MSVVDGVSVVSALICCRKLLLVVVFVFCKQKTAYEMRISDWSSDVCSSDLPRLDADRDQWRGRRAYGRAPPWKGRPSRRDDGAGFQHRVRRSEEHTSELQSLMRISYAVFCLTQK